MRSLRRVTLLTLAALLTVIGLIGAVTAYVSAITEANEFLDLQQQQIARYVGDLGFGTAPDAELPPHDTEDDFVLKVSFPDGRPARSSNPSVKVPDAVGTGFTEFRDASGVWRVYTLVSPERTVQIAQQMALREELAAEASLRAALPLVVAIPLSWLLLGLIVTRVFGRMSRVANSIAARDAADTTPIPTGDVPDEVMPLVRSMNDLLARLRAEMSRQRAFLSDAAHELRTPLTALTLQIGNLRAATTDPVVAERIDDLQAGAHRAGMLTNQLLRIARADAGEGPAPDDAVDLEEVVTDVVAGLVPLAESRSVDLGIIERAPVTATGSAGDFRTLIEVLVDNAIRHTPKGGTVDVAIGPDASGARVCVRDSGPGVAADLLPRLTERFFRGPDVESEGSGLGLAIARAIAHRHGVNLSLANRSDAPGFSATLTFPG